MRTIVKPIKSLRHELNEKRNSLHHLEKKILIESLHDDVFTAIEWVNKIGEKSFKFIIPHSFTELDKNSITDITIEEFLSENIRVESVNANSMEFIANWCSPLIPEEKYRKTRYYSRLHEPLYNKLLREHDNMMIREAKTHRDYFYDVIVPEIKRLNLKGLIDGEIVLAEHMNNKYSKIILSKIAKIEDIKLIGKDNGFAHILWDEPLKEAAAKPSQKIKINKKSSIDYKILAYCILLGASAIITAIICSLIFNSL